MKSLYRSTGIVVLLMFALGLNTRAQEGTVIAAHVYNFTRNIDWPTDNAGNEFIIDIIGHKSVYDKLKETVAGHKMGSQTIVVRYLETVENITQSQILFVGFWQSKYINKAIEKVGTSATLIITEKDGLIESGAGINLVIRNDVIKFEMKKENILKYGLKVSSALEKTAFKVY